MNDEQILEMVLQHQQRRQQEAEREEEVGDDMEDDEDNDGLQMPTPLHAYQLLCYDSFELHFGGCACHGLPLHRMGLSACHLAPSDLSTYVWARLEDDLNVAGVYFVAMWASPGFSDFSPVFMQRPIGNVCGMLIHVDLHSRLPFLIAVSRLGEAGGSPCLYMRKIDVDLDTQRVHFYTEDWFSEFANLLYYWQMSEWKHLAERMQ
ncbi:ORF22 [Fowl aviadenovirus A]|nr:ORF22 [Fowl aviadenovirus A]